MKSYELSSLSKRNWPLGFENSGGTEISSYVSDSAERRDNYEKISEAPCTKHPYIDLYPLENQLGVSLKFLGVKRK
jgi:hypothetical protein